MGFSERPCSKSQLTDPKTNNDATIKPTGSSLWCSESSKSRNHQVCVLRDGVTACPHSQALVAPGHKHFQ